jgi:hypothetical protein
MLAGTALIAIEAELASATLEATSTQLGLSPVFASARRFRFGQPGRRARRLYDRAVKREDEQTLSLSKQDPFSCTTAHEA